MPAVVKVSSTGVISEVNSGGFVGASCASKLKTCSAGVELPRFKSSKDLGRCSRDVSLR